MDQELMVIAATAASLGLVHTVIGPDHYLPFIVMAKARGWSGMKTVWITLLSGLGHIFSSILLGLIGIGLGVALAKLEWIESVRGDVAAWLLIAFGLAYTVWGVKRALRNQPHSHPHSHLTDGSRDPHGPSLQHDEHMHRHVHQAGHLHPHGESKEGFRLAPWVLFSLLVFGPCEPLIPLVMYPAAKHNLIGAIWVAAVFGAVTILTMLSMVLLGVYGLTFLPMNKLERYSHALAGFAILLCGLSIVFLGL